MLCDNLVLKGAICQGGSTVQKPKKPEQEKRNILIPVHESAKYLARIGNRENRIQLVTSTINCRTIESKRLSVTA